MVTGIVESVRIFITGPALSGTASKLTIDLPSFTASNRRRRKHIGKGNNARNTLNVLSGCDCLQEGVVRKAEPTCTHATS